MPKILNKHRTVALLGAAIVVGGLALPFIPASTPAIAAQLHTQQTDDSKNPIASVVAQDKPAVVTIISTMKSDGPSPQIDDEFRRFFEQQGIPFPHPQQQPGNGQHAMALGSGFIVSSDGVIVTNNHVIDKAESIKVTLDDGTELPAKLLGTDPKSDLAVLKIDAKKPLPTVAWGDSDNLQLGDQIVAIGNPFGIGTTVTAGIVSARGRDLHSGPYDDFIQIDAPINHGNSGGPLVDLDGNVVGINTAIYSPNGGSVGVGFAIPSDQAKEIVAKLEKNGVINHGYLGVEIQPVTEDVADALGLAKADGALIANVSADSPASAAGLKSGDVVTAVGDHAVKTPKDLARLVADLSPGNHETLTVLHNGKSESVDVTIGGNDKGVQQASASEDGHATGPSIGIGLANLTPDLRERMNLPDDVSGVVVAEVNPDKPAAEAGLEPGDLILTVNNKAVSNAREVQKAVADVAKSGRKSVLLKIERQNNATFVAVPFATT